MREKIRRVFFYLFASLENTCFVCNSMGNGLIEGAITSILKHWKGYNSKMHPNFFLILAESFTLLSWSIIKLIPLGASNSKYKSLLSPCNYTLENFQISERGTNERKILKRRTFLIFIYIITYRFLQKEGHMHCKITLFFA